MQLCSPKKVALLLAIRQERGEKARIFASSIQGKAATCAFLMKCTCNNTVDFTDVISKYVLINGLENTEIKQEVLGWPELDTSKFNKIGYIEQKEMATDSCSKETNSSIK